MTSRGARLATVLAVAPAGCAQVVGLGDAPMVVAGGAADATRDAGIDATQRDDAQANRVDDPPSDASVESDVVPESGVDGGSSDASGSAAGPSSCLDVKRRDPRAPTGIYSLTLDGNPRDTYCDMDMDDGGWTAFFVQQLGPTHVVAHFEDVDGLGNPIDTCPSAAASCLRHIPGAITPKNEFVVRCGNDAIKFGAPPRVVVYWQYGIPTGWNTLLSLTSIAGMPMLSFAKIIYTGDPPPISVRGWVISEDVSAVKANVFAGSVSPDSVGWDFCNGVDYNDAGADAATPTIVLFYR